jgi:DNA-binding response OmpR family regulator
MQASILVVENHRDLRSAIVSAFTREKYACDAVRSGDAAIVKLRNHAYDYILVDDDEATGASALFNELATHPDSPKLVVLTDIDRSDEVAFLRKPFDSRQLLATVSG